MNAERENRKFNNLPPDTSIDIFREVEILFTVIAPHASEGRGKMMKITKLYYLLSIALNNFVKLRRGSGKDWQGMAPKAKGLKLKLLP